MGGIDVFDIGEIKDKYNLSNYIETGTGRGVTLSYVLKFGFKTNTSIEIFNTVYNDALKTFKGENCDIVLGNSYEVLPTVLGKIDGNVLFFLDAHFPGADYGYRKYGDEKDINKRLPLEMELDCIIKNYDFKGSVFIIDDLRIYEDGPFEAGNWHRRGELGLDGITFIHKLLDETHTIEKDYRHQGYLIIKPKNTNGR